MSKPRTPITIESIKARCTECGDCWDWNGKLQRGVIPKIWADGKETTTRRLVWKIVKGPIPARLVVTMKCKNPECVNPDHMELTSRAKLSAEVAKNPATKLRRAVACAKKAREQRGILDMDRAREIRASDLPRKELAEQHGCSVALIDAVKANRNWRDYSNPFAGLGA